jgi:hypothetical protein
MSIIATICSRSVGSVVRAPQVTMSA